MQHVMCKICGERHPLGGCPRYPPVVIPPRFRTQVAAGHMVVVPADMVAPAKAEQARTPGKADKRGHRDRKVYMRKLMAKRRVAARKAKAPAPSTS